MIRTRHWAAAITAVLLLSATSLLYYGQRSGTVANIYLDNNCIRSVNLSTAENETFTVESDWGFNTIRVENGRIHIIDADCPDQICITSGWLSETAIPIVCLPHKLVIRLENKSAVSKVDVVSK